MLVLSRLALRRTRRTDSGCGTSSVVCITVGIYVVFGGVFVGGGRCGSLDGNGDIGGASVPSCGCGAGAVHRYLGWCTEKTDKDFTNKEAVTEVEAVNIDTYTGEEEGTQVVNNIDRGKCGCSWSYFCQELLAIGDRCGQHNDCRSNNCVRRSRWSGNFSEAERTMRIQSRFGLFWNDQFG